MRTVTLAEAPRSDGQPLFVEFVNTLHWYEGAPIELIGTEAELAAWLVDHGLPAADVAGCLPDIHKLREHVRGLTTSLATHQPLADTDLAAVQAALGAPRGSLALADDHHLGLESSAADCVLFSFQIALSAALFLRSPQRHRLKLCANAGCGFAFVDTSTNATRRWCFMQYCGNRLKVRAFRTRQKSGRQGR
jgi:predicted RNA-binding Zn ribbon-like protein